MQLKRISERGLARCARALVLELAGVDAEGRPRAPHTYTHTPKHTPTHTRERELVGRARALKHALADVDAAGRAGHLQLGGPVRQQAGEVHDGVVHARDQALRGWCGW